MNSNSNNNREGKRAGGEEGKGDCTGLLNRQTKIGRYAMVYGICVPRLHVWRCCKPDLVVPACRTVSGVGRDGVQ